MVKYARLVFEEEIEDDASPLEAMIAILKSIKNWLLQPNENDVEISSYPYERQE